MQVLRGVFQVQKRISAFISVCLHPINFLSGRNLEIKSLFFARPGGFGPGCKNFESLEIVKIRYTDWTDACPSGYYTVERGFFKDLSVKPA